MCVPCEQIITDRQKQLGDPYIAKWKRAELEKMVQYRTREILELEGRLASIEAEMAEISAGELCHCYQVL